MEIVNAVFAAMVSPFLGLVNLAEGMLDEAGMIPIGAVLQEPVVICLPFVRGRSAAVTNRS